MSTPARVRLRAEDAGDLAVISACLQDAVFAVGEMGFEPADKRFAAIAVRCCRAAEGGPSGQAAAIHFDAVSTVKLRGIDRAEPSRLLRLAGIVAEPGTRAVVVRLLFQEGAEVWLEAAHLACRFQDLEDPRPASAQPQEPGP